MQVKLHDHSEVSMIPGHAIEKSYCMTHKKIIGYRLFGSEEILDFLMRDNPPARAGHIVQREKRFLMYNLG